MIPHPWINKQQAGVCGKPVLVPREREIDGVWQLVGEWNMSRPAGDILLTLKRCEELGAPVEVCEDPCGYMYVSKVSNQFRYAPFYSRWIEDLNLFKINDMERRALRTQRRGSSNNRNYTVCLSCGSESNPGSCPICRSDLQIKLEWPYFIPNPILKGSINMEQAIAKIRTEMEGAKNNPYVQLIGNFLLQHLEGQPEAAEKILTEGKTIIKSLEAMKAEAQKMQSGGMAMLTDAEGYTVVLRYFGIEGAPCPAPVTVVSPPVLVPAPITASKGRFDVSLDELL